MAALPAALVVAHLQFTRHASEPRNKCGHPHHLSMETRLDPVAQRLGQGETIRGVVEGIDGRLVLTDKRVFISEYGRVTLDVPIHRLRLVEFDLETQRPASVIIVPEDPRDAPGQLAIRPQQYDEVASVLAQLGPRIEGPQA